MYTQPHVTEHMEEWCQVNTVRWALGKNEKEKGDGIVQSYVPVNTLEFGSQEKKGKINLSLVTMPDFQNEKAAGEWQIEDFHQ